ncbi:MAG: hypothetical protein JKY09_09120 [Crocinitomicaceae bacterium]|nr:hypothetical protein [Crocinitomicaceae bacterium]
MTNHVIEFAPHLSKRRSKQQLKKRIQDSGWDIHNDIHQIDSEVIVYLMDCDDSAIVLYGCKKADFPEPQSKQIIEWKNFLAAWHSIADPATPYDDKHKEITIEFSRWALPGLGEWPKISALVYDTKPTEIVHMFVISDRNDIEGPMTIIIARSTEKVMNVTSVQAILDNYYKAQ